MPLASVPPGSHPHSRHARWHFYKRWWHWFKQWWHWQIAEPTQLDVSQCPAVPACTTSAVPQALVLSVAVRTWRAQCPPRHHFGSSTRGRKVTWRREELSTRAKRCDFDFCDSPSPPPPPHSRPSSSKDHTWSVLDRSGTLATGGGQVVSVITRRSSHGVRLLKFKEIVPKSNG